MASENRAARRAALGGALTHRKPQEQLSLQGERGPVYHRFISPELFFERSKISRSLGESPVHALIPGPVGGGTSHGRIGFADVVKLEPGLGEMTLDCLVGLIA